MAKYHLTARVMELSEDIAAFLEQVKKIKADEKMQMSLLLVKAQMLKDRGALLEKDLDEVAQSHPEISLTALQLAASVRNEMNALDGVSEALKHADRTGALLKEAEAQAALEELKRRSHAEKN